MSRRGRLPRARCPKRKALRDLVRWPRLPIAALLLAPVGVGATPAHSVRAASGERENTRVVLAMWRGAIERGDEAAVRTFVSRDYIQHNVNVAPGRDGFLAGVRMIAMALREGKPSLHKQLSQLLTVVAQGDRVVLVWNQPQPDPTAAGKTYPGQAFDMFRLKDGLIVEHWDDTRKRVQADH